MTVFDVPFSQMAQDGAGSAVSAPRGAEWIECPDCGLFQTLPPPRGKLDRACTRCHYSFGTGAAHLHALLAISLSSLLIFIAANTAPILGIFIEGRHNTVAIAAAANGLFKQNAYVLGSFVLGLTVLMPIAHMLLQNGVLFCLWRGWRPRNLARMFLWAERVRPWAMLDVFLLAIFITISKLREMSQVQMLPGLWMLALLTASFVAFGACVDRQKIWDMISPPPRTGSTPHKRQWISCLACNLPHEITGEPPPFHCARCTSRLHDRKPDSIQRTWALVLASFALYIPANLYPVMTVVTLGHERPTTIMEGVRQLWTGSDWPYAILVFVASIMIPLFKLVGLCVFLVTRQMGSRACLVPCTRFYRIFDRIGRWSVLDVYVAAILGALVDFGNLANIIPGPGLLPFACVVVLTMLAVESFDPRLMWDAAEDEHAG